MSSFGRGSKVNIVGTSGNIVNVSNGNAIKTDDSFRRLYPLGKIRVGATVPVSLPNIPCSVVYIRNLEGNGNVYVGGSNQYTAQAGIMAVIYETEMVPFAVNNTNELSLIADLKNTDVIVYCLSNIDVNPTISNPPPPDITPPVVSSVFPSPGTVQVNTPIYFQFGEEMDAATVNTTNITISPSVSYTVTKDSVTPSKVLVIPDAFLAQSTAYTVTAGTGLADLDGNFLVSPSTITFTTANGPPGSDITPPTVVSTTPINNASDVVLSVSPTVSFSEAVQNSTLNSTNIKLFRDSDNTAVSIASFVLSSDQKTVTLTTTGLDYTTKYRLEVSGIQDIAGNTLASKYTTFFTTVAQNIQVLYQQTGNSNLSMYSGSYTQQIAVVNTSKSFLYNHKILKYTFNAFKVGNPTGTILVGIEDSNGNVLFTFENSIDVSTLTTSSKQYTISSTANTHVMAVGDTLIIQYSGGNNNNYVVIPYASSSSYNGSDTFLRLSISGFVLDYTDSDVGAIIQGV